MTSQLRVASYVSAFNGALTALMSPTPVYSAYNPNYAITPQKEFVVWYMRNIRQDVYTGIQTNKGIDHPIFQVNIYGMTLIRASTLTDILLQAWHGFTGNLNGISVGKSDCDVVLNTYDEVASLHQIVIDISMQVAVPTA